MSHSTGTLIPGPTAPSNGPLALTLESAWAPRASWVPCATDATHSRSSTRPPFYSPRSLGRRIETRCSRNKARPLPLPLCRRSTPGCRFETPVEGNAGPTEADARNVNRLSLVHTHEYLYLYLYKYILGRAYSIWGQIL